MQVSDPAHDAVALLWPDCAEIHYSLDASDDVRQWVGDMLERRPEGWTITRVEIDAGVAVLTVAPT